MNQKRHVDGDDADLDRPTPPGGPNRTDAPDGPFAPGRPAIDPGPEVERVTKRSDAQAPPPEHDGGREQSPQEALRQEENAEESDYGEPSQ